MSDIQGLLREIGIEEGVYIKSKSLFDEAFTHRSSVNEAHKNGRHNERLEFLGDAVLELITTDFLYRNFDHPEGELTNYRSALVKRENLAKVARNLNLGEYMRLSKGEDRSGGRGKDYLLANLVEALIGALYLSVGMKETFIFVERFVLVELDHILENESHIDSKSKLQEFTQGVFGITPHYEVLSESGLDHEKEFEIGAYLDGTLVGSGKGGSKKEAQIDAATKALEDQSVWEGQFEAKTI